MEEYLMTGRIRRVHLGLAAAVLLLAACQDLNEPAGPVDPVFSAQAGSPQQGQDMRALFARSAPEVMALPHTVFAGTDPATNRLVIGIERASAARPVQDVLTRLGVPATAYRVQVTEPIHFMSTTLRTAHRPTQGGIQIHWSNYVCTLGFNVDHAGGRSFITNSHCTNNQGTTGSTAYFQPASSVDGTPIAVEADDPSYARLAGCSVGKVCRYSDASRALYSSGTASTRGAIAKTTGENTLSLNTAGSFTITSQANTTTSFSGTLHKVGRTTGWTSGNVTNTCATVNVSGSNIQLLCQTLVQRSGSPIVQGGDSGSPVFRPTSGGNVELVGILWGGSSSGELFVFSPLKNIQDELGGMTATSSGSGGGEPGNGGGEEPAPCVPKGPNGKNCK
jgi:hypothetical protein